MGWQKLFQYIRMLYLGFIDVNRTVGANRCQKVILISKPVSITTICKPLLLSTWPAEMVCKPTLFDVTETGKSPTCIISIKLHEIDHSYTCRSTMASKSAIRKIKRLLSLTFQSKISKSIIRDFK